MKRKILILFIVFSMCFFGFSSTVLAQSEPYTYKPINLFDAVYYLVSVNNYTFTVRAIVDITGIDDSLELEQSMVLYTKQGIKLTRGEPHGNEQRYIFLKQNDKVNLMISINKNHYTNWCNSEGFVCDGNDPNPATFRFYMHENFVGYYVVSDYVDTGDVINSFLRADVAGDAVEYELYGEMWLRYQGVNVWLPDGSYTDINFVGSMLRSNAPVFEGYDFVAFYFNLSPRSYFWAPVLNDYYIEQIEGLTFIVYDRIGSYTIFYNYNGEVARISGIKDISNPIVRIPAEDNVQIRERLAYERGKAEGIEEGKEQGYNEGYRIGYNKGINEGVMGQLDLFGYLQALFGEQGLGRLLKLELLPGVSLGAVIMIPLAFFLVSFIMRWFR